MKCRFREILDTATHSRDMIAPKRECIYCKGRNRRCDLYVTSLEDDMQKDRIELHGKQFTITTIEPAKLTPQRGSVVVDALTPLTAEGFMCPVSPELRQDVQNHVLDCDELSYVREGKKVVAFTAVTRRIL